MRKIVFFCCVSGAVWYLLLMTETFTRPAMTKFRVEIFCTFGCEDFTEDQIFDIVSRLPIAFADFGSITESFPYWDIEAEIEEDVEGIDINQLFPVGRAYKVRILSIG